MSIEEELSFEGSFFVYFFIIHTFCDTATLLFYAIFKAKMLTFCLHDSKALHIFVIRKMS